MDDEGAKQIGERFIRAIETNEVTEAFADDVFCDINVPEWRFQMQGRDTVAAWLAGEQPGGCSVGAWRADATADGAVVEIEQHTGEEISRNLHRLEVRDGKITSWTMYCTGVWSKQTQETHAREAPMIRP